MTDSTPMDVIFVYGTLLKGLKRHGALRGAVYEGPALIEAALHDLGDYPGLQKAQGSRVVGELYRVDAETLGTLDAIEGYSPQHEEQSLFVRERVTARRFSDGSEVVAYSYFFNSYVDSSIEHGDYRRYLLEQCPDERWVLAYGSNLSMMQLRDRLGTVHDMQKGFINEFDLVFNKQSQNQPEQSFANIAFRGTTGRCPVVAYKLTPDQIAVLDAYEGVPNHYCRTSTVFTPELGDSFVAEVYLAMPEVLVMGASPSDAYAQKIALGYTDHAFDHQYLQAAVNPLGRDQSQAGDNA